MNSCPCWNWLLSGCTFPSTGFKYPEDLDVLNKIFEAPPAQLVMSQPFLDNPNTKPKERQDWLADGMKWVNNHIDELWEMGVGQE